MLADVYPDPEIRIRHEFRPGDVGKLISLHGVLYAQEYGFDCTFEAYVAEPLAHFVITPSSRERIWLVDYSEPLMGSIAVVQHSDTQAQLRWFLLHPALRGKGLGRKLLEEAIFFCRENDYSSVFLWTVSALQAAAGLYQSAGFKCIEENTHTLWGCIVSEQRYELILE